MRCLIGRSRVAFAPPSTVRQLDLFTYRTFIPCPAVPSRPQVPLRGPSVLHAAASGSWRSLPMGKSRLALWLRLVAKLKTLSVDPSAEAVGDQVQVRLILRLLNQRGGESDLDDLLVFLRKKQDVLEPSRRLSGLSDLSYELEEISAFQRVAVASTFELPIFIVFRKIPLDLLYEDLKKLFSILRVQSIECVPCDRHARAKPLIGKTPQRHQRFFIRVSSIAHHVDFCRLRRVELFGIPLSPILGQRQAQPALRLVEGVVMELASGPAHEKESRHEDSPAGFKRTQISSHKLKPTGDPVIGSAYAGREPRPRAGAKGTGAVTSPDVLLRGVAELDSIVVTQI